MPTTLPKRRVAARDQPLPVFFQISTAAVLLMAIFLTVAILDRAGLSFAPDGDQLVQSSVDSQWSLPIGFPP
jgi:hypothetical protein